MKPGALKNRTVVKGAIICVVVLAGVLIAGVAGAFNNAPNDPRVLNPKGVPTSPLGTLAVFDRGQGAAEAKLLNDPTTKRIIGALTQAPSGVANELLAGSAITSQFRVALDGLGVAHRSIYFFRTDTGGTCAGLTGLSAGCYTQLPVGVHADSTLADPDYLGTGDPAIVWGITRNDVKSVDVILNGTARPAVTGNNAYFFEAPDATTPLSAFTEIRVTLQSGAEISEPIKQPPTTP
jgi:hypothetical protein